MTGSSEGFLRVIFLIECWSPNPSEPEAATAQFVSKGRCARACVPFDSSQTTLTNRLLTNGNRSLNGRDGRGFHFDIIPDD